MTEPVELSRTLEYRGYLLVICKTAKQWHVFVLPPDAKVPQDSVALLKGWQEDEVLSRAHIRVNDILALRHPK